MGVNISFEGVADLIEEIEREAVAPAKVENKALEAAAQPIVDEYKQTSAFHDRSGKMRKSIGASKVKSDPYGRGKYIQAGSSDPDAPLVELGHGGPHPAPAHPGLEPAFNHHKDEATEIIKSKLREALSSG